MSFTHQVTHGRKTFTVKIWKQGIWYVNVSHNRGSFGMSSTILAHNPKNMVQGIKWASQSIACHIADHSDKFA